MTSICLPVFQIPSEKESTPFSDGTNTILTVTSFECVSVPHKWKSLVIFEFLWRISGSLFSEILHKRLTVLGVLILL